MGVVRWCSRCLPILLVALLPACADKPPAPIEDHSRPGSLRTDERYTVLRGDTLYSIAFRYGLDFRRLAAANSIRSPYTIYPGQELRLAEAEPIARTKATPTPAKPATSPPANPSVQTPEPAPGPKPVTPVNTGPTPKARAATSTADSNTPVGSWRWPAQGRVIRRFDGNLHKGIDISGERGDPVQATAGGRVVYAGSGLAGYGQLLILRHNDEYLSAYGHNDALLVGEGDVVRAGQIIARRGSSGTDTLKLHFEIRRRGRPVDPLGLLPSR